MYAVLAFNSLTLSVLSDVYVRQCTIRADVHAGSTEIIIQGRIVCAAVNNKKRIVWYHVLRWCKGGLCAGMLFG